jgi:hypothetical protein
MANNAINLGVQKRRFALLLNAGYGRCADSARRSLARPSGPGSPPREVEEHHGSPRACWADHCNVVR